MKTEPVNIFFLLILLFTGGMASYLLLQRFLYIGVEGVLRPDLYEIIRGRSGI